KVDAGFRIMPTAAAIDSLRHPEVRAKRASKDGHTHGLAAILRGPRGHLRMTVIIWCHWYKVMLKQKDELESHSSQLNRTLSLAPRAAYGPCWPQSSSRWVVRSAIKAWILCASTRRNASISSGGSSSSASAAGAWH